VPTPLRPALLLALVSLAAAGCGAVDSQGGESTRSLERYGIGITLPDGWHARLTRGTVEAATVPLADAGQPVTLDAGDVAVRLFEFEPDSEYAAEIARSYTGGRPEPFAADEFGPPELGGENPEAHGFARRNFSLAGRYFDLFVEAGKPKPSGEAVAAVNDVVASLEVRGGDFYPGTVEAPSFQRADGWYVGSAGGGEVHASDVAEAWAATVRYRNDPRDLPPARTLETLPADGILIWVGLSRDNRYPPTAELTDPNRVDLPLTLTQTAGGVGWEGQIREISLYRLYGRVGQQYDVDLWVFFGDGAMTPEQRARAQAMLDRLELPDWGSWELDGRDERVAT
jgi:hypothetical protein